MHSTYVLFIVAGAGVGVLNFLLAARRAGVSLGGHVLAFTGMTAVSAIVGARGYALVEQGWRWEVAGAVDGGLRLPGAVIGLLVGLVVWRQVFVREVPLGLIGDLGAVAVSFGLVIVRLGCLAAGCCFGTRCELPWAIRFPRGTAVADMHAAMGWIDGAAALSLPVHPLQVYFMLLHLGLGVVLLRFLPHKSYAGQVLLLAILVGQGGKALLEAFRQPLGGVSAVHLQAASALLALAAAVVLIAVPLVQWLRTVRVARAAG